MKRNYYVGTSGWVYKDWGERYYPKKLKEEKLTYLAREFPTVEVNSSFYRLPRKEFFEKWFKETPKDFKFAIKLNQYITHRKRLIIDKDSKSYLKIFIKNSKALNKKLAVILVQLPPSFKPNLERLEIFFKTYEKEIKKTKLQIKTAVEFRHPGWFNEDTYKLLRKYKAALVISISEFPSPEIHTSDFVYARFHGSAPSEKSRYLEKDLNKWVKKFQNYPARIKKYYLYFNNDYSAYAVYNARYLLNKLNKKK